MKSVSPKRAAERPQRVAAEKQLGREGTQGTCARCGFYGYVNGHERRGGSFRDGTKPDCLLCPRCNGWAEDFPVTAAWDGWKISRKHERCHLLDENEAFCCDGSVHTFGQVTV